MSAKKKTVFFAGEEIVISHIDSVGAYESNYKGYVVVKTTTREYKEEFTEPGYSSSDYSVNLSKKVFADDPDFQKHFGKVSKESIKKEEEEIQNAKIRLVNKVIARRDEILKIL